MGSIPTLAIRCLKWVGSAPDEIYSRLFYRELRGSRREGLVLYVFTLVVEIVIGGGIRLLLALLFFAALSTVLDPGWFAPALTWIFVFGSVAWSLLGLARPTIDSARIRASRPALREPTSGEAVLLGRAMDELKFVDPTLRGPAGWHVFDDPLPAAAAIGREILVSTGMLQHISLAPVIAHELGHANTVDARIGVALTRLLLWRGPARVWVDEGDPEGREAAGLLLFMLGEALRLAGGAVGQRLLHPLWSSYEYQREFVADRYTASLGEHWGLVTYFRDELDLVPNAPMRRLLTGMSNHPPAEERIERLENWSDYPRS